MTPEERRAKKAAFARDWRAKLTLEQQLARKEYMRVWHIRTRERLGPKVRTDEQRLVHAAQARARRARLTIEERRVRVTLSSKEYKRAWKARNREKLQEQMRIWRDKNREKIVAQTRAWAKQNPERRKEIELAWYNRNREKVNATQRAWYVQNKERSRAWHRAWRVANPGSSTQWAANRRAKKLGNGGSHTMQEWREKCALLGNVCIYCGEAKPLTRDHDVPLTRGGTDDIANLLPACKSCNSRKGTRTAREYLAA